MAVKLLAAIEACLYTTSFHITTTRWVCNSEAILYIFVMEVIVSLFILIIIKSFITQWFLRNCLPRRESNGISSLIGQCLLIDV